ncbi:MAG: hypothetical protein CVV44_12760 [Spirochaetae bacterium HGW-Spirochaetae-1]|jgi:hypothetical protein|nr:MAG: hypothetical protein CVV44_12760 [Spirochaetae bacterium HGW-Spirochaetae-1]
MKRTYNILKIAILLHALVIAPGIALYSQENNENITDNKNTEGLIITEPPLPKTDIKEDAKKEEKKEEKEAVKQTPEERAADIAELRKEIDDLKKRLDESEKRIDVISGLKISGFFDVFISNYQNKPNIFEIGDFELDFEHSYESFQVAAALVFNKGAELDVAFIDYHLYGGRISPRGRLFSEKGVHLQVGKFDVPFGNDWQHFAATDRISVSDPLTTELIMDGGYNDVGGRILLNFVSFYGTFYLLRGIEEGYSYGGNSFGGRVGVTPFSNPYSLQKGGIPLLDIGFSYIHDVNKAWASTEHLLAVDIESKVGAFILQGEYYRRNKLVGIRFNGFQITTGIDFQNINAIPLILFLRYDLYNMQRYKVTSEDNYLTRITGGININIAHISYLKFEYQRYLTTYDDFTADEYYSANLFYIQLMITF